MFDAERLANSTFSATIAPAGCGKTHLIAQAVAEFGAGRELILTHTHAGVDAIRSRLRSFGASTECYYVDTIAGWALRLAAAFPTTSGITISRPRTNDDYRHIYAAAVRALEVEPIQRVIKSSYSGAFVDEYQDCTIDQHNLILSVGGQLPCRVLGDPLQGIFGFGDNTIVDWDDNVSPYFEALPGPETPWRWANRNKELGVWLQRVRRALENGEAIDLANAPITWIRKKNTGRIIAECHRKANQRDDTTVLIRKWPRQCHDIANKLSGRYSCIEPIQADELLGFAEKLDQLTGIERIVALIDFAGRCMTRVRSELRSLTDAIQNGRIPRLRKHPQQVDALLAVGEDTAPALISQAIEMLKRMDGVIVYRHEMLRELARAIRLVEASDARDLSEAVWMVRNRTRMAGRDLWRCSVGTTLLVKGLEFDHAVVMDAHEFDARNLYVALTRGAKSLTVVSPSPVLRPVAHN